MASRKLCAHTGFDRRRRINCVSHSLNIHSLTTRWIFAGLLLLVALLLSLPAYADPDPCEIDGTTATCLGDQSDGIDIRNSSGQDVTVNSGSADEIIVIDTTSAGDGAIGIIAISTGSAPRPANDPFLGIPIPGSPGVGGGAVAVNNHGDITTNGIGAHGIYAASATTGYPASVEGDLVAFKNQYLADGAGVSFAVESVTDATGNVVATGTAVNGDLLYQYAAPTCDPAMDPNCGNDVDPTELNGTGGTFVINADGTFSFDEGTDFDDLEVGETRTTSVSYSLSGSRLNFGSDSDIAGLLIARVTMTDSGLEISYQAVFGDYGNNFLAETGATVFPDLAAYIDSLILQVGPGGSGNSVTVNHLSGNIVTNGFRSHGIFGESHGLNGRNGHNGGGFITFGFDPPTGGGNGSDGGTVSITADSAISTNADQSIGIFAYSRGGNGGIGGDGGTYYGGRRGGDGGNAGLVEVFGVGSINTTGDHSIGIFAFSEGGNGGLGGDGGFAAGGALGGYGGIGGSVLVDGSWDITTHGDDAHGIWAKSVGGSAGPGGSGGWLGGGAGAGGQGADGGQVEVFSNGVIETFGDYAFAIHAQSVGGFGGSGGVGDSIFASSGGNGQSAGSGGDVLIQNLEDGATITHGLGSHAIFGQSVGGGGGSGGSAGALFYSGGGDAAAGGDGGNVLVENWGLVETFGLNARGVFGQSIGGGGGDGGFAGALVGSGGDGSGTSIGGTVDIHNWNQILTHGSLSDAVYAQSIGGGGGSGGAATGIVAIGGSAGGGGDAGAVSVDNSGLIATEGDSSRGVFAQSIGGGGGDGGFSVGLVSLGGDGGIAGQGAAVTIDNSGEISTEGLFSQGIFAQSIGGGGGSGAGSLGWFASLGGQGGAGGSGGNVFIDNDGLIVTDGLGSQAIFAQSVGGGGGNAGITLGFFAAIGGDAGDGSIGGTVDVDNLGILQTNADHSAGIFAQSIGGGGGNGAGSGGWFASLGGSGGSGGLGGLVDVTNDGLIMTAGNWSHSIFAQSIGGGGGSGGGSGGVWVAIGGSGGTANHGGNVLITNNGELMTLGLGARGIHAQSIGGGGGSGGGSGALNIAIGGSGGGGGLGGDIEITNAGSILTAGDMAQAIFAQSVGGSGGDGGNTGSMFVTVGGAGGGGNDGGLVDILNSGLIATLGNNSTGIFAQSVGGSGGSGGNATSVQIAGPISLTVAVGGDGGAGGDGGGVEVENTGSIATEGVNSDGVFAQSVGGSGGAGGSATTASLAFPVEIEGVEIPAITMNVAVGGSGAGGGTGGIVDVTNSGNIWTTGFLSNGVFAQSVGGSGGRGGNATNIQIAFDALFAGTVAVGGSGGQGGIGNTVSVENSGLIHTQGDWSAGVFAQSVGGGGGLGGDATTVAISLTPPPTSPADFIPSPSMSFDLAIGGDGGTGAVGGYVEVINEGTIITEGHFSTGVMAQSVGGAGGAGGDARIIQVDLTADPMDFLPLLDLMSLDVTLVFGGTGGDGGHGGDVDVTNDGDVATSGAFSHGIVAQSVGGGGGSGGSAATFEFSNTDIIPDIPILDDISGLTTIEMTFQGSGGAGGDGGDIWLDSFGNVWTEGDFAMGVVAQSVAGGGGLAGFFNPHGIINNEVGDAVFNALIDTDAGFSFAGSVGGAGTAGDVIVNHTGDIQTLGDGAHGLFAQSAAGQGSAGNVDVTLNGSIYTFGDHAYGIFAQSGGLGGNGDITLTINDGVVMGGSGMGSGLFIAAGDENSIWNEGLITSVTGIDGYAIKSTGGDETIENRGTVTGSVDLGGGENYFINYGLINAGIHFDLGAGNLLFNEGDFAPGGVMNVFTTNLTGDFEQTDLGTLWFDLQFDFGLDAADLLNISGSSILNGTLGLILLDTGSIMPGQWETVVITSAGGIDEFGLTLDAPASAVIGYSLMAPSETEYSLYYNVDFAPTGLTPNQTAMGVHFNDIQLAGGTEMMKPLTASIVAQPDVDRLAAAYDLLSPHIYSANQIGRLFSSLDFEQSMHSCSVRDGDLRFSREGDCTWMRVSNRDIAYEGRNDIPAATDESKVLNMGIQTALSAHWHGGIAVGLEESEYEIPLFAERDGNQVQLGGILKGRYGNNAINFSTTYGKGDYQTRRFTGLPGDDDSTGANRDIDFLSAHAGYAYNLEYESWYLQPAVDIAWINVSGDGFDETGTGPSVLFVKDTDDDYLTSRIGFEFGGEISSSNKMLYRPFARAAFTRIHSGTTNEITGRLAGAPDSVPDFTQVLGVDDGYHSFSLGIDILASEHWAMSLVYDRQSSDRWTADSFFAKVMFEL